MNHLTDTIQKIADTAATNEKIDILKSNFLLYPELQTIFYYAYSPKFVYGLKKVSPIQSDGDMHLTGLELVDFTKLLNALHLRELTGNNAIAAVNAFLNCLTFEDQELACNIIKGDLRCGLNATNINKAMTGLIELPPPYQRCSLMTGGNFDKFPDKFYSQVKADGMYLSLHLSHGAPIQALTRAGNEFPIHKFKPFYDRMKAVLVEYPLMCAWYTGEVVMRKNGVLLDRKTSNGITNKLMKGGEIDTDIYDFEFFAWDRIPTAEFRSKVRHSVKYETRLEFLKSDVEKIAVPHLFNVIETITVDGIDSAMQHYNDCRARGLEGTVIKNPEAGWMDGTSPEQIKMKAEVEIDLRIVGMNPGKGKNEKTFGSLQMVSECGMLEVNVSGFTDEARIDIFENFESIYMNSIATVRANELITSKNSEIYSLFLPRFISSRFDKTTADDLQRIKQIFESVM